MARKFVDGKALEQAVELANTLYHDGLHSVRHIARHLGCSWYEADLLITYSRDKWDERKTLADCRPLHFDEVPARMEEFNVY